MNYAVSNRHWTDVKLVAQPGARNFESCRHIGNALDRIGPIRQRPSIRTAGSQPRASADPVHLALDLPLEPAVAVDREDLELHAGGSGIDDKDGIHGDHAAV